MGPFAMYADLSPKPRVRVRSSVMKYHTLSILLLLQATLGFSQGTLYSFSGSVSSLFFDGAGILAAQNVAVGDPVAVAFYVDFAKPGHYLLNDGTVEMAVEPPLGNVHTEYFYSRLVSGTLLPELNGGFNNRPGDIKEYFTSWNRSDPTGSEGLLQGGGGDSFFSVRRTDPNYIEGVPHAVPDFRVQDWQVGTEVRGIIVAWSDQDWSIAWADMHLDSITQIPEPTSLSLLFLGGVTYFGLRCRKSGSSTRL